MVGKEVWKTIEFDFDYTNRFRMEISNYGRVRTFNKISDGKIIKGSILNGYKVVRLKLYKPRSKENQKKFDSLKKEISGLYKNRRDLLSQNAMPDDLENISELIEKRKAELSKKLQRNLKKRTINYHFFVHKMVATYFLPKPSPEQTIVGHLDFDKLNNLVNNLKWMTPEENYKHQANSPYVKADKQKRKDALNPRRNKGLKLDSTQVMRIKLQIKRKKPVKQIAREFNISEMQVWRIKSGENWAHVKISE